MKTRKTTTQNSKKTLRLEALENREMLSATPVEVAPFAAETADFAAATLDDAPIDLSSFSAAVADPTITFTRTSVANQFRLDWEPIEGAASYNVKILREGSDTWITYAKPTDNTCLVNGLHIGKNYSFKVFGVNEKGKLFGEPLQESIVPTIGQFDAQFSFKTTNGKLHTMSWNPLSGATDPKYVIQTSTDGENWYKYRATLDTSITLSQSTGTTRYYRIVADGQYSDVVDFTPVTIQSNISAYKANQEITVSINGGARNDYNYAWSYVTPDGDVLITEAANLTSYTPTTKTYPIKVTVSENGGEYTQNITVDTSKEIYLAADDYLGYSELDRTVEVSWLQNAQASEYRVYKKVGDAWVTNAIFKVGADGSILSDKPNQEVEVADKIYYQLKMLDPGVHYGFKVTAVNQSGKVIAADEITYTPVAARTGSDSYKVGNNPQISVSTYGAPANCTTEYLFEYLKSGTLTEGRWRPVMKNITEDHSILQATSNLKYRLTVTTEDRDGKVVSVSHAYVLPIVFSTPHDGFISFPATHGEDFVIEFAKVEGVDDYEVQFCPDIGLAGARWYTLPNAEYTSLNGTRARFTHTYGTYYKYEESQYRVRANVNGDVSGWLYINPPGLTATPQD